MAQGGAKTFTVAPKPGILLKSLVVDGISVGPRDSFSFNDVRSDHTIAASFACKISAEAGFGGGISPCGDVLPDWNDSLTFKITPMQGYSIASVTVDGKDVAVNDSFTFRDITSSHALSVKFQGGSRVAGNIPQTDQLIFASLGESLPEEGTTGAWPTLFPKGGKMSPISTPTTTKFAGRKYSRNVYSDGDGYAFKTYAGPIACRGASVVAVARPVRNGASSGWFSIVDVFYDRLVLGIHDDSGRICVRRNGPIEDSTIVVPDGQVTLLSLIVQPEGRYKVYANGAEVIDNSSLSPMTSLLPGEAGFAKSITIGRNCA